MRRLFISLAAPLLLAACGNPGFSGSQAASQYLVSAGHVPLSSRSASYLGVYEPGVPQSYQRVENFAAAVSHVPDIVIYYSAWGEQFQAPFAASVYAHGSVPLVQIDPRRVSIKAIAAGRYDAYIRSYATQVRAFGHQVIIGFAHEMNASWYPWGYGHVPPATWISAWRRIVTIFRQSGADNVTWLWTVNRIGPHSPALRQWWPGGKYVTWVGIDGYYFGRGGNFANVFGLAITAVRKITAKPVLISETSIAPAADPAMNIPALFRGIRKRHLLGLVWFDQAVRRDWRLEENPRAVAAFRLEMKHYR